MTQRRSRNARRTRRTRRKAKTPAKIRDVMAGMWGGSRGWYLRWGERAHRKRRVRADENGRTPGPVARARAWGCVCRGSVREPSERVGENETRWNMQRACIEPARAFLARETAGGGSVHAPGGAQTGGRAGASDKGERSKSIGGLVGQEEGRGESGAALGLSRVHPTP